MPLTFKELSIIDDCATVWNKFIELEELHPDDKKDVKDAIHTIERIVMKRSAYRDHPDVFTEMKTIR